MKAEVLKERPKYELFKQSDVVSFYHLQLPRWLIENKKYSHLSIEAKFVYTMLFNRFQLSKYNNWINDDGEVFIIYTRKELSDCLNISEKKVSAAMNDLRESELIWERRCGRGFANQIYLANVKISIEEAVCSKGNPTNPPSSSDSEYSENELDDDTYQDVTEQQLYGRTDKLEFLSDVQTSEAPLEKREKKSRLGKQIGSNDKKTVHSKESIHHFKNDQNRSSSEAKTEVQEQLTSHPSNKDINKYYISNYEISQCQSMSNYFPDSKSMTDEEVTLRKIIDQCEMDYLDDSDVTVISDAIERLFYSHGFKVGSAVYPNHSIRSNLMRLDGLIIQDVISRITKNTEKVKNSSAYVTTVLFNTIMESGSDLIVDPYLNYLRRNKKPETVNGGG